MKISQAGGTIGATTLESYLYGLIKFGQAAERNPAKNPQSLNYITSTQSDDSLSLSLSVSFPYSPTITNGIFTAVFNDYLQSVSFTPGTGTLKSTNWVSQVVEAIALLDNAQANTATNPAGASPVGSYTFSSPSATGTAGMGGFSASVTLKLAETLNPDGSTAVSALEVL